MLAKYYRLRIKWNADQTLTYNDGARVSVRCSPWKIASGNLSYGTTDTDDFGFGAGDTIADEGEEEATVIDNTSDLYWGVKGYLEVTADADSTDGTMYLYLEESDDNTNWPSDQADFEIEKHLRLVGALVMSTDAVDEDAAINFEF